jgi:hypothetical protein
MLSNWTQICSKIISVKHACSWMQGVEYAQPQSPVETLRRSKFLCTKQAHTPERL